MAHKPSVLYFDEQGRFACDVSDFQGDDRTKVTIDNREVVIFYKKGNYYALDTYCFHEGGHLDGGDIEDIDGRPCVKCPKHRYRICIENGERFMEKHHTDPPSWESKGVRQRTHTVTEKDGKLYVKLSDNSQRFDSDKYNPKK